MDPAYASGAPLTIGHETQLLIDDAIVEDRWKLERQVQPPSVLPHNPVLVRDKPWEGDSVNHNCVLFDEERGRYRMWYNCYNRSAHSMHAPFSYCIAYAESEDGFRWEKPLLDVCPVPGFARTNVVYAGTHFQRVQGVQFLRDPDAADPNRRYRMVSLERRPDAQGELRSSVSMAVSRDGLRWTLEKDIPPALDYHSDCVNHVVHDPRSGRWLLYCRPIQMKAGRTYDGRLADSLPGGRHYGRRVAVATSADGCTWSYPRCVLYPDERDLPDIDSCCVFRYASHFLMFYNAMDGDGDATGDVYLASSTDGLHWQRTESRTPFLARGCAGPWSAGQVLCACPPVRQGETLLLYFMARDRGQHIPDPVSSIGLASCKQDRFVQLVAGDEPGFLLTKEFLLQGRRLTVNVAGVNTPYCNHYVKAELCRHPGPGEHAEASIPYPGFSLEESRPAAWNNTAATLSWKGGSDLQALAGKPVYLRFQRRNAGIYSFCVEP